MLRRLEHRGRRGCNGELGNVISITHVAANTVPLELDAYRTDSIIARNIARSIAFRFGRLSTESFVDLVVARRSK